MLALPANSLVNSYIDSYGVAMSMMFVILMALAMLGVLVSLFTGLVSMTRGGDFNRRNGNKMMRMRVLFQGLALLLFVAAALSAA